MDDPALGAAVSFIAELEAFSPTAYQDVGGVWTIGYGFTYLWNGSRIDGDTPPMTQTTAADYLRVFVMHTLAAVRIMLKVKVTVNQAVALTSFAYNEGTNALRMSTLLRDLNAGLVLAAEAQFDIWDLAGGHVVKGLENRREKELALFRQGCPVTTLA